MTQRVFQTFFLFIVVVAAGCAGGTGSSSPLLSLPAAATHPEQLSSGGGTPNHVLFVAGLGASVGVYTNSLYAKNPSPMGSITQGIRRADGLAVDRHGVLYVSNSTWPPNIVEYQPGASAPFKGITSGLYAPGFIAVDTSGNLYVSDTQSYNLVILVYPPSASSPTQTIVLPYQNHSGISGLAFDRNGNLLVGTSSIRTPTSTVYSVAPGTTTVTNLNLQGLGGGEIGADAAGNIYAGGPGGTISVHAPGSTTPTRYINAGEAGFYGALSVAPNGAIYWPNWDRHEMFEFAPGAASPTNILIDAGGIDAALGVW